MSEITFNENIEPDPRTFVEVIDEYQLIIDGLNALTLKDKVAGV